MATEEDLVDGIGLEASYACAIVSFFKRFRA